MTNDASVAAPRAGLSALAGVFASGRYAAFFAGMTVSMVGQWMQRIALGWILWETTQSGTWLGVLAIAELAPALFFGPLGGVLADRMDRRRLVMVCQAILGLLAVLVGVLIFARAAHPVAIALLVGAAGAAAAMQEAARSLILRDVTPPDCLATGLSLTAISINVTRFIGPAIAGPLILWSGPALVCWINAAFGAVLLLVVASLKGAGATAASDARGTLGGELLRGLAAAATHGSMAPVLFIFATTAILIRPLYELMPAFAERLFDGGVQGFSVLVMSVGAGAIVGAAFVALRAPARPAVHFMWASLGACAALAAFALSRSMTAAAASAAALGFCMCISAAASQLVVVMEAPAPVAGRALSLWGALMRGGPALGALAMGASLAPLGYRWPLLISAALSAATIGFVLLRKPASLGASFSAEDSR